MSTLKISTVTANAKLDCSIQIRDPDLIEFIRPHVVFKEPKKKKNAKDDKRKFTNWGFVLAVISITIWALTSGANLAFAGVISGLVSTTTQLTEAQNALAGAVASKNMALVGQMTGAVTGLQMAMMSLNITAGVINAISLATHQIATTIFLLANILIGLGMTQTKSLNSLVSKILVLFSILGFVTILLYPVSSNPGYAIGGMILTVIAILWIAKGLIIFKLK